MTVPSSLEDVTAALRTLLIWDICDEPQIHRKIMEAFDKADISYSHEHRVGSRRFDFWIDGIVVEVKKNRPERRRLLTQIQRYTSHPDVRSLVLVFRNFRGAVKDLGVPRAVNDKPVRVISLNLNWGVAV